MPFVTADYGSTSKSQIDFEDWSLLPSWKGRLYKCLMRIWSGKVKRCFGVSHLSPKEGEDKCAQTVEGIAIWGDWLSDSQTPHGTTSASSSCSQ